MSGYVQPGYDQEFLVHQCVELFQLVCALLCPPPYYRLPELNIVSIN